MAVVQRITARSISGGLLDRQDLKHDIEDQNTVSWVHTFSGASCACAGNYLLHGVCMALVRVGLTEGTAQALNFSELKLAVYVRVKGVTHVTTF